jgi:hypothetical protein
MVKRVKVTLPTETTEKPIAAPTDVPQYDMLAAANLMATSPGRLLEDQKLKMELAQDSVNRYVRLNPRNGQESIISMLTIGITNASLDCLAQASHLNVDQLALRDLRHAFKGAQVASDLIKALNDLRGEKPEKATVGLTSKPVARRS